MKIGIIYRYLDYKEPPWPIVQLKKSIERFGHTPLIVDIGRIYSLVGTDDQGVWIDETNLSKELSGAFLRSFGRGNCDSLTYRISAMEQLEVDGVYLMNSSYNFRRAKDKYAALFHLYRNGLPVPKTLVSRDFDSVVNIVQSRFTDFVIKPLIGSQGMGSLHIRDFDLAYQAFKTLDSLGRVFYVQEYIKKPPRDIRIFVIGDRVISGMYRIIKGDSWKSNIHLGAEPKPLKITSELEELALKAVEVLKLDYAGVDIVESEDGYYILETNAAPSWEGLQKVTSVSISDEIVRYMIDKLKR
ncbi:MAG: RimK family alpha-L-glutamate ligase [Candidatus Asgardarchaeia archaeon]